jgi:hypothetical protein
MRKKEKTKDPMQELRDNNIFSAINFKSSDKNTVLAQENDMADMVGGKRHSGSGSSPYLKSDASSDHYQIEAKQTEKKSISLKMDWLKKIYYEAVGRHKQPMLTIRFLNMPIDVDRDWIMIPKTEFEELIKK